MLKIVIFLHLSVRWDVRSETWFKTLCILIRSQTLLSDESLRLSNLTMNISGYHSSAQLYYVSWCILVMAVMNTVMKNVFIPWSTLVI